MFPQPHVPGFVQVVCLVKVHVMCPTALCLKKKKKKPETDKTTPPPPAICKLLCSGVVL